MIRRLAIAGAMAVGLIACATDLVDPVSTELAFGLESIDGVPLPFTLLIDYDIRVAVISDVIRLRSDSTFVEIAQFRGTSLTSELVVTDSVIGTYTRTGPVLYLLTTSAAAARFTFDGSTLTQSVGRVLVYTRR